MRKRTVPDCFLESRRYFLIAACITVLSASGLGACELDWPRSVCGNGKVEGPEQCDSSGTDINLSETCETLGFESGTLACKPDCTFDPAASTAAATVLKTRTSSATERTAILP